VTHYTQQTRAALRAAVDARKLAGEWAALHPQAVKATGPQDPRVVSFLQAAWNAILAALRAVIRRMSAEGWVLGQQAAQAVLGALEAGGEPAPDWRQWAPGDHEAAARIAGAGLRELLGAAEIRIKSIADSRVEELADVLEQTLASDVTIITAEGPLPPRLSVGDLARQLEEVLDSPERAELVAWTEISRAQGEAARAQYAEAGYPQVDWITAMDARVCPRCEEMQATNPHPLGVPPLVPMHPRCRCAEIPALEGAQ
jgi:SPP1 gp7 family putative phage head morphogenesis protein